MFYSLKRVLLATVIVCVSTPVFAEKFEKISAVPEGTMYLDVETINRVEDEQLAYTLIDYMEPHGSVQSMKQKFRIDCVEKTVKFSANYAYSGRMGQGNVLPLFSQNEKHPAMIAERWESVPAGTPIAKVISKTCSSSMSLKDRALSLFGK